uniref:Sulfotransferase n=1 Tax=Pelusios castaneus TaxID=367368 RepID=A0A8C8SB14_9SAUR
MDDEYFTHKGVLFPCAIYSPEILSSVENEFQLRDDDLFNITYPKSGTNWMLEILSLIRCEGDPGWVRSVPNWDRAPWVETHSGLEAALKYPPPRLLTSHLPVQLFPKSLQHSQAKVRIIYTLRCPKDVLVSYYHYSHVTKYFKTPGSLDSFLEDFLSGNGEYQWGVGDPGRSPPIRNIQFVHPQAMLSSPLSSTTPQLQLPSPKQPWNNQGPAKQPHL